MNTTYHREYRSDQTVMQAMRVELGLHPAFELEPEARSIFDELIAKVPTPKGVDYEAAVIGGVSGWWCRPSDAIDGAAILYLHGGAYILGSTSAYRNFAGQIAIRAKAATFIADYKLAPEHRFPGALDDALAAYRGISEAGYSSLALAGDSAGGGLALSLISLATAESRNGAVLRPVAAAVMSPWTDLALTGNSMETKSTADPILTRVALEKAAKLYLGEQDARDPHASPLYADLTGLPPVLLHVGDEEILLDDSRRSLNVSSSVGGSRTLSVWQGMVHVFPSNLEIQAAREALEDIGNFLRSQLGGVIIEPQKSGNTAIEV
jgi:monoterpene epsilon-lactone hydrolase